ncbi:hypothetical protein NPIL_75731 [Nephila pilipes]|uniref:Uncharacterized protein n=1 Tax=Nephila pilipes TaxID=299642 RepID=A0A8X6PPZ6_NEPPI|nr:hypothetical protein NPIL_75731 [Nephila pilipes]
MSCPCSFQKIRRICRYFRFNGLLLLLASVGLVCGTMLVFIGTWFVLTHTFTLGIFSLTHFGVLLLGILSTTLSLIQMNASFKTEASSQTVACGGIYVGMFIVLALCMVVIIQFKDYDAVYTCIYVCFALTCLQLFHASYKLVNSEYPVYRDDNFCVGIV